VGPEEHSRRLPLARLPLYRFQLSYILLAQSIKQKRRDLVQVIGQVVYHVSVRHFTSVGSLLAEEGQEIMALGLSLFLLVVFLQAIVNFL
jgi:hypothetical protein